jgi:hypothetical protein
LATISFGFDHLVKLRLLLYERFGLQYRRLTINEGICVSKRSLERNGFRALSYLLVLATITAYKILYTGLSDFSVYGGEKKISSPVHSGLTSDRTRYLTKLNISSFKVLRLCSGEFPTHGTLIHRVVDGWRIRSGDIRNREGISFLPVSIVTP